MTTEPNELTKSLIEAADRFIAEGLKHLSPKTRRDVDQLLAGGKFRFRVVIDKTAIRAVLVGPPPHDDVALFSLKAGN